MFSPCRRRKNHGGPSAFVVAVGSVKGTNEIDGTEGGIRGPAEGGGRGRGAPGPDPLGTDHPRPGALRRGWARRTTRPPQGAVSPPAAHAVLVQVGIRAPSLRKYLGSFRCSGGALRWKGTRDMYAVIRHNGKKGVPLGGRVGRPSIPIGGRD